LIKTALLVVTLVGGAPYETEMPTMKECMEAREKVIIQGGVGQAVCLPYTRPAEIIQEFFSGFTNNKCGDNKWRKMN